jgi:hypothetical protein
MTVLLPFIRQLSYICCSGQFKSSVFENIILMSAEWLCSLMVLLLLLPCYFVPRVGLLCQASKLPSSIALPKPQQDLQVFQPKTSKFSLRSRRWPKHPLVWGFGSLLLPLWKQSEPQENTAKFWISFGRHIIMSFQWPTTLLSGRTNTKFTKHA